MSVEASVTFCSASRVPGEGTSERQRKEIRGRRAERMLQYKYSTVQRGRPGKTKAKAKDEDVTVTAQQH